MLHGKLIQSPSKTNTTIMIVTEKDKYNTDQTEVTSIVSITSSFLYSSCTCSNSEKELVDSMLT